MEPDKKKPSADENQPTDKEPQVQAPQAPADALSLTPDEVEQEEAEQGITTKPVASEPSDKKLSPLKRFMRKTNVYLLGFVLVIIVVGAISVVTFLNSQKAPVTPNIAGQTLTPDALKQLASTNVTVGSSSQTLTIQGNQIVTGQTLMRGNLDVAGNIQAGGSIEGPTLTVSGTANLGTVQINSLQVAANTAIQGTTTLHDLNVAGSSSFSGPITASQITVTKLILSGNASLAVPNHISFPGSSPSRTIDNNVLGSGGSTSLNGSDTAGTVNINTGNNTSPGCFVQIKFNQAFPSLPHVIVSPVGVAAGQTQYYVTRSTTSFNICTANAAPTNQTFAYDYFVTF